MGSNWIKRTGKMKTPKTRLRPSVSSNSTNHTLHLYTSKVNKYILHKAFLTSSNGKDKEVVYVTADKNDCLMQELNSTNVELEYITPEKIRQLEITKDCGLRIIIDAGSIPDQNDTRIEEREIYLNKLIRNYPVNCLCTYDVAKLNLKTIKKLIKYHNQLRLTTSDLTILSGGLVDKSKLSEHSIEKMVKDNLETIILALLQKKPMHGTEIIGTIHLQFNVLLSPGTVYPLLHSLKQRGLVKYEKYGRAKTYTVAQDAEPKIKHFINEHIQARRLLNHYLQKELTVT